MTPPSYGDLATLKSMLGISDTNRDSLLTLSLSSASRQIDRYTSRRFYQDSVVSQRTYTPERRQAWYVSGGEILVDDISTAAGLIIEEGYQGYTGSPLGTWTNISNDYILQPDNAIAQGWPITGLRRAIGTIEDPYILLRVTAQWGWPYVPDDITYAALLQAERLFRRKDVPEGVSGPSDWGSRSMTRVDPDVQALCDPYAKSGMA